MKQPPERKWISLADAIEHVMRVENCSKEQAFEFLREKLAAGKIRSRAERCVRNDRKN
jgi:hypothetical protein